MLFNSLEFALFLPGVFLLYWFVFKKNAETQNILLLLASIVFYCMADWKFISLLATSGFVNYYLAKHIANNEEGEKRRWFFYLGIAVNIGILFYFKYFNFFIKSFVSLFNYSGSNISFTPFHILLPLGISFFTFQMIGYLVDVNNEEIKPTNDLLSFLTYLFYFPKILSGPIERVQRFLPQIQKKREFDYDLAVDGLRQILWGLFKKIVIADSCAKYVDTVFNNYQNMNGSTLLLGAVFCILTGYADFSGYSDIACGVSKLFNIRITNNFAFPFFSTNISSFWQKWHISLTSWMMDYVFTPMSFILRGYKKSGLIISILVTFLLVGLWHGGNWTYIAFGVLNGLYFIPLIFRGSMKKSKIIVKGKIFPHLSEILRMLGLFLLISLTFLIIRAENIRQAIDYIGGIFNMSLFSKPYLINRGYYITVFFSVLILFSIDWLQRNKDHGLEISKIKSHFVKFSIYFFLIGMIFWIGGEGETFIYFQF